MLASAAEDSSLPVTTLPRAAHPSSGNKDLPVGATVDEAVGVDIMGQLPGYPTARLPLPTVPTQAHGQVRATQGRRSWGLNLQMRPQAGAKLGPGTAQGGRGAHLDFIGIELWSEVME